MIVSHGAEIRYSRMNADASDCSDKRYFNSDFAFPSQVDQLRSELMQERSARHDLEMDKGTLERQVHTNAPSQRCEEENRLNVSVSPRPTGEGAQESRGRHGGTESTLGWDRCAGKQNPGVGGEVTQRREVREKSKVQSSASCYISSYFSGFS